MDKREVVVPEWLAKGSSKLGLKVENKMRLRKRELIFHIIRCKTVSVTLGDLKSLGESIKTPKIFTMEKG